MKNRIALLTLATAALVARPAVSYAAERPAEPAPEAREEAASRPLFVGVELIPVDAPTRALFKLPATGGMLVIGVAPGSPSEGRIGQGDILLKLDDQVLVNREQMRALVRGRKAGDEVALSVIRGGRAESVTVKLAPIPAGLLSPALRGGFADDPARHEELLRRLTERTRRMLGESGLAGELLDEAVGDVTITAGDGDVGIHIVSTRTYTFPEGTVTVVRRDGKTTVSVKDKSGKVLVEGELTDELRAKLPDWAKAALERKPEPAAKPAVKPDAPVARGAKAAREEVA